MYILGSIGAKSSHTLISIKFYLITHLLNLGMVVVLVGCHSAAQQRPVVEFDTPGIKQVLVLPFKSMPSIFGENISVRSPISDKIFVTGSVSQGAESLLSDSLLDYVSSLEYYQVIPPEKAEDVIELNREGDLKIQNERHKVTEAGRKLGADVVLVGYLYRFKERIGTNYAVDSPASVAFDINMISTHNGELLWSADFDETQQSLSENLFLIGTFIKRRGIWVTAEQMATMALDELFENMPKPRLEP